MEILLIILFCVLGWLFVIIYFDIMDSNRNEEGFNKYNSSLGVQCDAKEKCDFRFSFSCNTCKHNC